ncbi:hypothetical protein EU527_15850 [Candidatus Thorarchaeota archaeon]|nr:MAG: hypothetical protein EU527_15850 [Candidatus Thorarchaeota archaeon]
MVVDHSLPYLTDVKGKLHDLVELGKVSSIEMISELIAADEDTTKGLLHELLDEGSIHGKFSSDGRRFFLTNVKVSQAPIILQEECFTETKPTDTKTAKIIAVTGLMMLILGSITRNLANIDFRFDNLGTSVFMIGLVVLVVGWILVSRANPPQKI